MPRDSHDARDAATGAVSPELDAMVCDVIGYMLDELAEGRDPGVLACAEDGMDACLEAAQALIKENARGNRDEGLGRIERYAVAYAGVVRLESCYQDAVLVSFYERGLTDEEGAPVGYSAYVAYENAGAGDEFVWSDPAPAGEEPPFI